MWAQLRSQTRRLATARGIKRTWHGKEKQKDALIREVLEHHVSHDTHSQSTDGSPLSSAAGIVVASVDPPPSLDHAKGDFGLKEIRRLAAARGIKRTLHGKEKQKEVLMPDTHSHSTDGSPSSSAAGIAVASVPHPL